MEHFSKPEYKFCVLRVYKVNPELSSLSFYDNKKV